MSQIKFLLITGPEIEVPLENGEGIMVMDPEGAHYASALISNEPFQSKVFAPEINWYLKHTQADKEEQKRVLKLLYEIRAITIEKENKDEIRHIVGLCKNERLIGIEAPFLRSLDGCEIPKGYLPIVLDTNAFLSTQYLPQLVKESGYPLILYIPSIKESLRDRVNEINALTTRISTAHNKETFDTFFIEQEHVSKDKI